MNNNSMIKYALCGVLVLVVLIGVVASAVEKASSCKHITIPQYDQEAELACYRCCKELKGDYATWSRKRFTGKCWCGRDKHRMSYDREDQSGDKKKNGISVLQLAFAANG